MSNIKTRIYSKNSLNWSAGNQFRNLGRSIHHDCQFSKPNPINHWAPPKKKHQMFQTYNATNMKIWDKHEVWPRRNVSTINHIHLGYFKIVTWRHEVATNHWSWNTSDISTVLVLFRILSWRISLYQWYPHAIREIASEIPPFLFLCLWTNSHCIYRLSPTIFPI